MSHLNENNLQFVLRQIQLRTQVKLGRTLTHSDMAEIAGVSARSFGDWMRGVSAPNSMTAVFELLSQLPESDAVAILHYWKDRSRKEKL